MFENFCAKVAQLSLPRPWGTLDARISLGLAVHRLLKRRYATLRRVRKRYGCDIEVLLFVGFALLGPIVGVLDFIFTLTKLLYECYPVEFFFIYSHNLIASYLG